MTVAAAPGINMKTTGVHHVTLRSTDVARSRVFYGERLGFPIVLDSPELFIFLAGSTAIGIRAPTDQTPANDSFDPFRVGLDHIALACNDTQELRRVAEALTSVGVEHTGVKMDPTLQKEYLAFKDPDGVKWELYMAE
jgi:catechol 2,3-dioxygenase-like lactoylglutathione lyase family enzyme